MLTATTIPLAILFLLPSRGLGRPLRRARIALKLASTPTTRSTLEKKNHLSSLTPLPLSLLPPVSIMLTELLNQSWWTKKLSVGGDFDNFIATEKLQNTRASLIGLEGLGASKHAVQESRYAARSNRGGSWAPTHAPKPVRPDGWGLKGSEHASESREDSMLTTTPTGDSMWAMPPPPQPTPWDNAPPVESRRRVPVSPKPPPAHPFEPPLASGDGGKPPAPPVADSDVCPQSKLAAAEDLEAKIKEHEDQLNSASALLSGYTKRLGSLIKQEGDLGEKLKVARSHRKDGEEEVRKQQAAVKEEAKILGGLRQTRDKLSAEIVSLPFVRVGVPGSDCTSFIRTVFASKRLRRKAVLQN